MTPCAPPPITVPRSTPATRGGRKENERGGIVAPPEPSEPAGAFLAVIAVKYAQVSNNPSLARSVAPSVVVVAREPTTSALMIRGEAPRRVTRMPLNEPFTSDPSLREADFMLSLVFQRCRGETLS